MSSKWKIIMAMRQWEESWFCSKWMPDSKTRPEITQICDVFRGKIIDVAPASLIIEATGNENKIKAF